jgi:hypothetical protein
LDAKLLEDAVRGRKMKEREEDGRKRRIGRRRRGGTEKGGREEGRGEDGRKRKRKRTKDKRGTRGGGKINYIVRKFTTKLGSVPVR